MIYEIYRQDEGDKEIILNKVVRYHTESKRKAFAFMSEKNKMEGKNVWRVSKSISHHIIFDLDDENIDNLIKVITVYESLFHYHFRIIKTFSGYHLISEKKYDNDLEWQYDTCRVLYPSLEKKDLQRFRDKIGVFVKEENEKQIVFGLNRQEFLDSISKQLKCSGLFCGTGDFDIYFCLSVIQRGKYSLRISKKHINDHPYETNIEELRGLYQKQ